MGTELKNLKLIDLIPDSIAGDQQIIAAAKALDKELGYIRQKTEKLNLWGRIDEMTEPLLSHLACHLQVDFWEDSYTDRQKRELLKTAIIRHRKRGTPSALADALKAIFDFPVRFIEWQNYGGHPHHFKIEADMTGKVWSLGELDDIKAVAKKVKNVRSELDEATAAVGHDMPFGGYIRFEDNAVIGPYLPVASVPAHVLYCGIGIELNGIYEIGACV